MSKKREIIDDYNDWAEYRSEKGIVSLNGNVTGETEHFIEFTTEGESGYAAGFFIRHFINKKDLIHLKIAQKKVEATKGDVPSYCDYVGDHDGLLHSVKMERPLR